MSFSALERRANGLLPRVMPFLRRLVNQNSFTRNAEGVAKAAGIVEGMFRDLGMPAAARRVRSRIGYGEHLFLHIGAETAAADAPIVCLVSHLDTVYDPAEVRGHGFREGEHGRIYGAGTCDIHGGTCVLAMALCALREEEPSLFASTRWVVGLNASEEVMARDFAPELLRQVRVAAAGGGDDGDDDAAVAASAACAPRAHASEEPASPAYARVAAALVFEFGTVRAAGGEAAAAASASPLRGAALRLVRSRKGMAVFRLCVRGTEAHAGNAHAEGMSAIGLAAAAVAALHARCDAGRALTVNVGRIAGGTVHNTVAGRCDAEVELRAADAAAFEEACAYVADAGGLRAAVAAAAAASGQRGAWALEVEEVTRMGPWQANEGTDGLIALWRRVATGEAGAAAVDGEDRGGLSDGNALARFFPTLDGLGPSGGSPHCSVHDPERGRTAEHAHSWSLAPKAALTAAALARLLRERAGEGAAEP